MVRVGAGTSWVVGVVARAVPPPSCPVRPLCVEGVFVCAGWQAPLFSPSRPPFCTFFFPRFCLFSFRFFHQEMLCVGEMCVCVWWGVQGIMVAHRSRMRD